MKKIIYIVFSFLLLSVPLFSQSEIDALRFSREDLHGTARAMSMGGAFGALGGDLTGVSINPAGIAVYRSSEVVGTLNLTHEGSVVDNSKANRTPFGMDNLGFVGFFPLRNDIMPLVNFGFSYNKQKSFNKNVKAKGRSNSTLVDFIYDDFQLNMNNGGITNINDLLWIDGEYDPFITQPWLPVLGRNTSLLHPNQNGNALVPLNTNGEIPYNMLNTYESGYIDNYDFTVGTTINNVLNIGISLSIKNIYYELSSAYQEDFESGGYVLNNWLTVRGAGVGAKLGVIYRPVNTLRIGLAFHTPTWYTLSETYRAEILQDVKAYLPSYVEYDEKGLKSAEFLNDYNLKTPGKVVASVATVLGSNFIASLDYELMNYGNMRLQNPPFSSNPSDMFDNANGFISDDFKLTSTVKLGMEYRFTPQFSGRLGYAWMQNPYGEDIVEFGDPVIVGSNTIFRMEGDANYFTGGLGYRFNRNFYLDMALVYKTQTDELYPFPNTYEGEKQIIEAATFSLKNNSVRGLLTLGYKF